MSSIEVAGLRRSVLPAAAVDIDEPGGGRKALNIVQQQTAAFACGSVVDACTRRTSRGTHHAARRRRCTFNSGLRTAPPIRGSIRSTEARGCASVMPARRHAGSAVRSGIDDEPGYSEAAARQARRRLLSARSPVSALARGHLRHPSGVPGPLKRLRAHCPDHGGRYAVRVSGHF